MPGQKFIIITYHRALTWLYSFKEPDGVIARWLEKLGQFQFQIKHETGKNSSFKLLIKVFFITEDMDNQVGKTTDTLKNIWE